MTKSTDPRTVRGTDARRPPRRGEVLSLLAALLVLLGIVLQTASCGDDDLIFPGEVPFTSTPAETDTPEPTDDGGARLMTTPVPVA